MELKLLKIIEDQVKTYLGNVKKCRKLIKKYEKLLKNECKFTKNVKNFSKIIENCQIKLTEVTKKILKIDLKHDKNY